MISNQPPWMSSQEPLPLFRQDIQLHPGPDEPDGSPTYNLFDPIKVQYYRIGWEGALILKLLRPGMTLAELTAEVQKQSTLKVSEKDISGFFEDALMCHLLTGQQSASQISKEFESQKVNIFNWLLGHYLYIRIPLLNPDEFLAKTIDYVRPLASPVMLLIYAILCITGFFQLIARFDEFIHTFPYFFNVKGAILYALTITLVKVIHEFAHAYTAKNYHVRVPAIGVALVLFWPVLYTDVTDSWKLSSRRQRLAISAAGVAAELVIAGLCTFAWALTSPGVLQSLFFIISSVLWISTLLVNINPAMRFDGYYLLCDYLGIDNLQSRAFAFTRWKLRYWLLGLKVPPPEDNVILKHQTGMIFYSFYTWIYRIFLYTTIASIVYFKFTKVLGVFLFFAAIYMLIITTIVAEIRYLKMMWPSISINYRSMITLLIVSLLSIWFIFPFPHEESFPGIVISANQQIVYVPDKSEIAEMNVKQGQAISRGDLLVKLSSFILESAIQEWQIEKQIIEKEIYIAGQDEKTRPFIPEKNASLSAASSSLKQVQNETAQLTLTSDVDGTLYYWDPDLRVGQSVSKDQVLGKIADFDKLEVVFFIPEKKLENVKVDQKVVFTMNGLEEEIEGTIHTIDTASPDVLIYPSLASVNGGDIPVNVVKGKELQIVESYYMIYVKIDNNNHINIPFNQTGYVTVRGEWHSLAVGLMNTVWERLWKESSI